MELLLIAFLWFIILSNNNTKPTSDQTRNELIETKKENTKKIGRLEYVLNDAKVKVNEERSKYSEIQNNPDKPFKIDRRNTRLVNLSLIALVVFFASISTITFIDPIHLPQWLNDFIQKNTIAFELLKGTLLIHLTTLLCISMLYAFVSIWVNAMSSMDVEQNCRTKLKPIERFLEEKRDELESLERIYAEYVEEKTRMLEDLKIRNIEIDELIKKKENLIKND